VYPGRGDQVQAEAYYAHPAYRPNDASSVDIGVVITAQDLSVSVMPLLLSRDARVGETAVIAGWGKDENGNGTTLRAGTTTISTVGTFFLQSDSSTMTSGVCSGDSGGPLLLLEGGVWAIAGVISAGTTGGACTVGPYYYAAVRNVSAMNFVFDLVPSARRQ
jgi:hypothetical protein